MKVYHDFFTYSSGIYKHTDLSVSQRTGYHSVRIVGWGEEVTYNGVEKYWVSDILAELTKILISWFLFYREWLIAGVRNGARTVTSGLLGVQMNVRLSPSCWPCGRKSNRGLLTTRFSSKHHVFFSKYV